MKACPAGAILELSPGRYEGPVVITRPMTIKGAGDLSRVSGRGLDGVFTIDLDDDGGVVTIESILVERGRAKRGGGIALERGKLRLVNVQIRHCRANDSGGAIHLSRGRLEARRIRTHDVAASCGGAIRLEGSSVMRLEETQIHCAEASVGGAIAVTESATAFLERVTLGRCTAKTPAGGQAIFVRGSARDAPRLALEKVRFEDAAVGAPVAVEGTVDPEMTFCECDCPRGVRDIRGVADLGRNLWR